MTSSASCISTGHLPEPSRVRALVDEAHVRFASYTTGRNADYIPALARVPQHLFGVCLAGVNGNCFSVGDAEVHFTIQSISKPFVFGLICQAIGEEEARLRLGVNSTGLPFNRHYVAAAHDFCISRLGGRLTI